MEANHKKILKAIVLELRHMLEGYYSGSDWHAGDLEQRLNALGVWRDRSPLPADELAGLSDADRDARKVVDAYLKLRDEAGVRREEAVAEFVRETAYTWANRLLALRCMEARELIDEVILQKDVYGGRSLEHNRLAQGNPELCAGSDDGLFAVFGRAFAKHAEYLPLVFDPNAPGVSLKPSVAALKRAVGLLSGTDEVRAQEPATAEVFRAPDALGWAYQYYQQEEKQRIDDWLKTKKGFKCEGADIAPKTALYTESYMVKFLVQNSLGAMWARMHPQTKLAEAWAFYIKDADASTIESKRVQEMTFLDPACGSGHFLIEAFDLFYAMYEEEGLLTDAESICKAILEHNLCGIDIDERAIQITEATLWMKAAEAILEHSGTPSFPAVKLNVVATNLRLPKTTDHLKSFLDKHPEDHELSSAIETVIAGLHSAHELGSLLQIEKPVELELRRLEALRNEQLFAKKGEQMPLYHSTPVQGQLPIGIESYDDWKASVLGRLSSHLATETRTVDLKQAFWGRAANRALELFYLLSRRYDVVATNPPFLGSKSMPERTKNFVARVYPQGKRDLLAAFIVRAKELACPAGFVAIVSQQTVLFLKSYADLRGAESEPEGLLRCATICSLVQLGSGAFSEISGVVVSPILVIFQNVAPSESHRLIGIRTTDRSDVESKEQSLQKRSADIRAAERYNPIQNRFLAMSRTPIPFWLPEKLLDLFDDGKTVGDNALARQGICTTSNNRFLRFYWELPGPRPRWVKASKGGGFAKWLGFDQVILDWEFKGARVKRFQEDTPGAIHWSGRMPADSYFFRGGWSYSAVSTAIGAREIAKDSLFLDTAPVVIARDEQHHRSLGTILNTRIASYLVRSLTQDAKIREGYVQRIPWPSGLDDEIETTLSELAGTCIELRKKVLRGDPTQWEYSPSHRLDTSTMHSLNAILCCLDYEIETIVGRCYGLDENELENIFAFTGSPACKAPLVEGLTSSEFPAELSEPFSRLSTLHASSVEQRSPEELENLRAKLKVLYEGDTSSLSTEDLDNDADGSAEDDDCEDAGELAFRVPYVSFVERLSDAVHIHPVSTALLLCDGITNRGWHSPLEAETRIDAFVTEILSSVGIRWLHHGTLPAERQANSGDLLPLTDIRTATEVIRSGLVSTHGSEIAQRLETQFVTATGMSLEQWLLTEAFKYHTARFRRRPIFWHIKNRTSSRRQAAFELYCSFHALTTNTLVAIQSHHVRPLRQRYESELRGIESIPLNARSDRQQERLSELTELIAEVRGLDERLDDVSRCGFGPETLLSTLRQYSINDAILCLTSRWLQKLSAAIGGGPLASWCDKSHETRLHGSLGIWVTESMSRLRHHCSSVGPAALKAETLLDDPTSESLAFLICKNPDQMVQSALKLACMDWWRPLDEAVFAPLRAQIKSAKGELKELKKEDYSKDDDPFRRKKEIEARTKELKESVKRWERDLNEKTATANELRDEITAWECSEARSWETWLAAQPMYDTISSLDGIRQPPRAVAEWVAQESAYAPDINDGVRVNIAPLQKAGVLAAEVLASKDMDKAIADRADWRADERCWCREGKLPQPGWWPMEKTNGSGQE